MSDTPTPADVAPEQPAQEPEQTTKDDKAPSTTDWKAESRKWEQRARENKAAADRLAELEESSKSAEQKAADRLAAAEKAATDAEAKVMRRDVALEFRLGPDDAALLDTITDEAAMRSLAERLAPSDEQAAPRAPRPDPLQGRPAGAPASSGEQFAHFFNSQIGH